MLKPGPPTKPDLDGVFSTTQLCKPAFTIKARSPLQKSPSACHPLLLPYLPGQGPGGDAGSDDRSSPSLARRKPARPELSSVRLLHLEKQQNLRTGRVGGEALFPSVPSNASATPFSPPSGWVARSPAILLPSATYENDTSRIRNCGAALQGRFGFLDLDSLDGGLSRAESAPDFGTSVSSGSRVRTPRTNRGVVRNVDKFCMHYPDVDPRAEFKPEPSSKVSAIALFATISRASAKLLAAKRAAAGKDKTTERSFWTKTFVVRKEDEPSPEQEINMKLKDTLFDLRRISRDPGGTKAVKVLPTMDRPPLPSGTLSKDGRPQTSQVDSSTPISPTLPPINEAALSGGDAVAEAQPPDVAEGAAAAPSDGEGDKASGEHPDDGPMYAVLKDLEDTEEELRSFIAVLEEGQSYAEEYGGARHATAIISKRTLDVCKRKAHLLQETEARVKEFEEAHAQRDDLLPLIVADTGQPPRALQGAAKFVKEHSHHPGEPVEANKSDFNYFTSTFKLPKKHKTLVRIRELMGEVGEWWAEACVNEAIRGAGYAVLQRLWLVAVGSGIEESHPKLIRAMQILKDRLAENVLNQAKYRQDRDAEMAKATELPPVGPATASADKIEEMVRAAIKEKVPAKDRRLLEALQIAKRLREEDGQRKRLHNRQKRLDAEAKGQKA